jgi:hypothetical protein
MHGWPSKFAWSRIEWRLTNLPVKRIVKFDTFLTSRLMILFFRWFFLLSLLWVKLPSVLSSGWVGVFLDCVGLAISRNCLGILGKRWNEKRENIDKGFPKLPQPKAALPTDFPYNSRFLVCSLFKQMYKNYPHKILLFLEKNRFTGR